MALASTILNTGNRVVATAVRAAGTATAGTASMHIPAQEACKAAAQDLSELTEGS